MIFKKNKNKGNMVFVLTVSALIITIASSIAILCSIMLNSAKDEILNNQLNFIASSAKAQIMYRLQAVQYRNTSEELRNLLEKDWENIVLGNTDNFTFDPSFDSSFAIDETCQAKLDFKNGKYSSKCNFYGTFSSEDVPAYSMDLKISAVSNNKKKFFRAMVSRKWPFCLSSGTYKANIMSGSIIDGDIYSGYTDENIGITVKNTDSIPSEIEGDLIVKKVSKKSEKGRYLKELFFQNKDEEIGIAFDSESEEVHKGNIIYTENTFYTDGLDSALASLVHESNPKIIDNVLLEKGILRNIQSYQNISDKDISLKDYISDTYNISKKQYMEPTISKLSDQLDELLKTSNKVYILQNRLKLAGPDSDISMDNPTLIGESSYKINGSVIAFPSFFKNIREDIEEEDMSFGIEARNCTLYINGDLILIGDSENLRYSSEEINRIIMPNNISLKSTNKTSTNVIPYLKGTKTSIIVNGNIFLSGGYIESAEERLAIYSNENMYLRPILITDNSPQSVFKGALACRKSLQVITSSNLTSNDHDSCRMKIYGAIVCGMENSRNEGNNFKNSLFGDTDKSIDVSYLDITYNSENIDFLNRTIGVPMLTFWSDI